MSVLAAQPCPTLCDLMDCSLPGSSVHGILQAILGSGKEADLLWPPRGAESFVEERDSQQSLRRIASVPR